MTFENTLSFARELDAQDPLRAFRDEFLFPQHPDQARGRLRAATSSTSPATRLACNPRALLPR